MPTDLDTLPQPSSRRAFLRHSVLGLTGGMLAAGRTPVSGPAGGFVAQDRQGRAHSVDRLARQRAMGVRARRNG